MKLQTINSALKVDRSFELFHVKPQERCRTTVSSVACCLDGLAMHSFLPVKLLVDDGVMDGWMASLWNCIQYNTWRGECQALREKFLKKFWEGGVGLEVVFKIKF